MTKGKIVSGFTIRLLGAMLGSLGFFLLVYQQTVLGTALLGVGSLIIAVGEG